VKSSRTGFCTPSRAGAVINGPDDTNAANTSVLVSGGQLLALWEGGSPVMMDPETLETKGFKTYRRDLKQMPFLAHPRVESDGTVWNLGGNGKGTFVWKLNPDGSLAQAQMVPLDRNSYFHDFTATARHLIIVMQPWVQDGFKFPLSTAMNWKPELGTRVLVIDKNDLTKRRVFELPAFAFFHLADGWEEKDGTIRFDGCIEADPTFGQRAASALLRGEHIKAPTPMLTQFVLRPDGKAEMQMARVAAEFPANDKRMAGQARRFTTHVTGYRQTPFPHAIANWDWSKGRDDKFDFGSHQLVEEFLFVANGEGERNGWLMGTTLNLKARRTELHLLNAKRVSEGPVATWQASMPLPLTFHGTIA
jgi:carotenoid cleavage dioxygenase-like enzyme